MTAFLRTCALMGIVVTSPAIAEDVESTTQSEIAAATNGDELDLHDIISSVSSRTNKRFVLDPRVRATVSLVGLNARDVTYPILLRILDVHGFSARERDGVVVVLPDALDRLTASPVVPADSFRAPDVEMVTAILAVKNTSAAHLVPILRPLMPQRAHLAAVVDRNALIIVDQAANIRRLVAIVEALDRLPAVANPSATSGNPKND